MKAKRMISFSLSMSRIAYLFVAIGAKLVQTREKPPHFCEDFFSLIYVWSGGRDSNSRHSAWKADALPTELPPLVEFKLLSNSSSLYNSINAAGSIIKTDDLTMYIVFG